MVAITLLTMIPVPDARPFKPSMMLNAFEAPAVAKAVKNIPIGTMARTEFTKVMSKFLSQTPVKADIKSAEVKASASRGSHSLSLRHF